MKNLYKNLVLGSFLAAVSVMPTLAQDVCKDVDANQVLYKKYTDNYAGPDLEKIKTAIAAAEEYIQKYEPCKDDKGALLYADQVNYFKGALPERKTFVANAETALQGQKLYDRFNAALKTNPANVGEIISSGKAIAEKYPDADTTLDVAIVIASAAFDENIAKGASSSYNADLITYAKKSIAMIEAGKTSKTYGAGAYGLKSKDNALGILNYSLGLAMVNDPAQKKDAGVYFYKSAQYTSPFKKNPLLYQAIGANYLDEILVLDKKRTDIITANGGKDNDESLAIEAMQRGYAERALDAYAKAYSFAKAEPTKFKKEYLDGLSGKLKGLYTTRFEGKTLDNVDTYATAATSKTLVDPSTTVEPIKEEVPAPATTTPPTSGTTTAPATTTPATTPATKPATTTTPAKPTAPATTPKADASTEASTTASTDKTKAKKPTPKKKGTR